MGRTDCLSLLAVLGLSGCFDPKVNVLDVDTNGTDDGSTSTASSPSTGTTDSATTTGTTTDTTDTTDTTETTDTTDSTSGDPSSGTTETEDSTGETELGPRIIDSIPASGDLAAPINGAFRIYFDRIVSTNDAVGHLYVSQGGNDPVPVAPQLCPPDADPTCIAGVFPASFLVDNRLPGGTQHQIIVDAGFPDLDDVTNTMDQVIDFTTFDFQNNVYDDSGFYDTERGGLVYDPIGEDLYIGGVSGGNCVIRRLPVPGGVIGTAETVATLSGGGGPYCYGLDLYEGRLMVPMSYGGYVQVYDDLTLSSFDGTGFVLGPGTSLQAPHDDLDEVWSTVYAGGRYLISFGNFHTGDSGTGIVGLTLPDAWTLFQSGQNLWQPGQFASEGVDITVGQAGATNYVFALSSGDGLFRLRLSDGVLQGSLDTGSINAPDVFVDGYERLYVAGGSGLTVYDADDFSILATRSGIDTGRIAVVAGPSSATVYYMGYRDEAVIGRMTLDF
jgi:hypothetical protein